VKVKENYIHTNNIEASYIGEGEGGLYNTPHHTHHPTPPLYTPIYIYII